MRDRFFALSRQIEATSCRRLGDEDGGRATSSKGIPVDGNPRAGSGNLPIRDRSLCLGLVLLLVSACVSPPPPRSSPDRAVIGASVKLKQLIGSKNAEYVFFARLDEDDSLRGGTIRSNYERNGYVYLFDALPGRYAVVSAGYTVQTSSSAMSPVGGGISVGVGLTHSNTINVYVPQAAVKQTVVTVGAGESAFLGDIRLDSKNIGSSNWEPADELQRHYYSVLAPGHEGTSVFRQAFQATGRHDPATASEITRDESSVARFIETSRRFAGGEWADALRAPVAAGLPAP